jgi:hypothetical protein
VRKPFQLGRSVSFYSKVVMPKRLIFPCRERPYSVGGFCAHDTNNEFMKDVEFTDEMTYHVPFQTGILGARLRVYCWHVCRCADNLNPVSRPTAAAWERYERDVERRIQEESDSGPPQPGSGDESTGSRPSILSSDPQGFQCGHH